MHSLVERGLAVAVKDIKDLLYCSSRSTERYNIDIVLENNRRSYNVVCLALL